MIKSTIYLGELIISATYQFIDELFMLLLSIKSLLSISTYTPKLRALIITELYYNTIWALSFTILSGIFFGFFVVGYTIYGAIIFSLESHLGSILIGIVYGEVVPFFTLLVLIFRAKITLHKNLKDNQTQSILELLVARIASAIISMLTLSTLFGTILLFSGYIFSLFFLQLSAHDYSTILIDAITIKWLILLLCKLLIFGILALW